MDISLKPLEELQAKYRSNNVTVTFIKGESSTKVERKNFENRNIFFYKFVYLPILIECVTFRI